VYRELDDRLQPSKPAKPAPDFHNHFRTPKSFKINTSKSLSKQTTLTLFAINTYGKQGGGVITVNQQIRQHPLHRPEVTDQHEGTMSYRRATATGGVRCDMLLAAEASDS
jgi:hypothetical protein